MYIYTLQEWLFCKYQKYTSKLVSAVFFFFFSSFFLLLYFCICSHKNQPQARQYIYKSSGAGCHKRRHFPLRKENTAAKGEPVKVLTHKKYSAILRNIKKYQEYQEKKIMQQRVNQQRFSHNITKYPTKKRDLSAEVPKCWGSPRFNWKR